MPYWRSADAERDGHSHLDPQRDSLLSGDVKPSCRAAHGGCDISICPAIWSLHPSGHYACDDWLCWTVLSCRAVAGLYWSAMCASVRSRRLHMQGPLEPRILAVPFASHDEPKTLQWNACIMVFACYSPLTCCMRCHQGQACSTSKATRAQVHGSALRRTT